MGSNADDAKGRVKEAVGDVTGDRDLEREGKLDQAGASVKEFAENAKDKAADLVDSVKDKLNKD
ncbi:MAG TPA: CsbD family protein [Acidimicrobiales bacterium]|nr:CsbD family protein [Acidimicrobiales bacterium]